MKEPNMLMSKRLYQLAQKLPPVKRLTRQGKIIKSIAATKIRGETLIDAGYTIVNGEVVDAKKFYRVTKPLTADHYANLKYNYTRGGIEAVEKYVMSVQRVAYNQLPFRKKVGGLWVFFKSRINKFLNKK